MLPDVGTDIRLTLSVNMLFNCVYCSWSTSRMTPSSYCLSFLGICNSTLVYHNLASGETEDSS